MRLADHSLWGGPTSTYGALDVLNAPRSPPRSGLPYTPFTWRIRSAIASQVDTSGSLLTIHPFTGILEPEPASHPATTLRSTPTPEHSGMICIISIQKLIHSEARISTSLRQMQHHWDLVAQEREKPSRNSDLRWRPQLRNCLSGCLVLSID